MNYRSAPMAVAIAAALAVSVAGSAGAASNVGRAAKSAGPIKVLTFGDITGAAPYPLTEFQDGVVAAVDAFNASGGVNGRKVDLITCNTQTNPADAANCVAHAKQEGVVAAIPSLELLDNVTTPLLEKQGIPIFSEPSTAVAQYSKTSACFLSGPYVVFPAAAAYLAKEGAKSISFTAPQAAGQNVVEEADQIAAAAHHSKAPTSAFFSLPATTTDFSSVAASATSAGETGSFINVNPPGLFSLVPDLLQDSPGIKLAFPSYILANPEVLAGLAKIPGLTKVYVDSYTAFPTDSSVPGIRLFQSEIAKVNKADLGQEAALFPWVDAWGAMQVLKTMKSGAITASTVWAATKKAHLNFEGAAANWHYQWNTLGLGCVNNPDVYTGTYNGGTTITPSNYSHPVDGLTPAIIAYYKKALASYAK